MDELLRELFANRMSFLDSQQVSARVHYVTERKDYDAEVRRALRPATWAKLLSLRFQAFGPGDPARPARKVTPPAGRPLRSSPPEVGADPSPKGAA